MFEVFGDKWGFQYSQEEWDEVLIKYPQYKLWKELWAQAKPGKIPAFLLTFNLWGKIMKIYQKIAIAFGAYLNCVKSDIRTEWEEKHAEKIEEICKNELPSGSGFDSGTTFDFDKSQKNQLVFHADFHHMDDNGYYCGWSEHTVVVTPDLCFDFNLKITGRNVRDIKDYIAETYNYHLNREFEEK